MELLRKVRLKRPDVPVVMLAGDPNVSSAVAAMRQGAFDYVTKPLDSEKLAATVLTTLPGGEARSLAALAAGTWGGPAVDAVRLPGAVLLAGERLAEQPGALSALLELSRATGARVAWVPRRADQ